VTVSKWSPKMRRAWLVLGSLVVAALAMSHWSCEVPPLMAPGSSITLIANPEFIAANGGVSVITAIVTEPAGTFVPDGSVVFFFTNLGRIDPQGKTVNGVARVNLIADSRSGPATVTAFAAGGAAPAASGGGGGGGDGTAIVRVAIGSLLPATGLVTANPPTVRGGGQVAIVASVFDPFGNPVANVPVIFTLGGQVVSGERLESGSAQRFTDSNGQAFDTLITRVDTAGRPNRPVQVTANVPGLAIPAVTVVVTP
jgi:hypothetical protein